MSLNLHAEREKASVNIKKSAFLPVGITLIVLGLFVPSQFDQVASQMHRHGLVWRFLLISSDLIALGFFAGIACTIIGVRRNRKIKSTMIVASEASS